MKRKKTPWFFGKFLFFPLFHSSIIPLFLISFVLLLMPQNIYADKGPFYFLEYGGSLFLRYLPFVGLTAIIKIYLLKRKFSLDWQKIGKILVKTLAEIYAEIIYFLLLFFLLSPIISAKILDKVGFINSIEKNPAAMKLLFTIIILLPLQCLLAVILNLVLIYIYWSDRMTKSCKDFKYGLLLSLIFPLVLIAFVTAGILSGHYTPLL